VFKFVGGLVLGFVLRSVGGYLLEQVRGTASRSRSAASSCTWCWTALVALQSSVALYVRHQPVLPWQTLPD
jgi:hypothetical protein